jgi:GTP-binding protein LepA
MTNPNRIRNFSIIAHIDHGKSTLADRMLEITGTVEARKMKAQVLDSMELERERGITIKMQPVRMEFAADGKDYILNLIDTPGHIDFSYEVSRAMKAVEGCLLLVDSTQGVQAQTLTTLGMAKALGLTIIPVVSKIDSPLARIAETKEEIVKVLGVSTEDILECSGKTGQGVQELLQEIIRRIPPPTPGEPAGSRGLVFDFQYSNHRGVTVYLRVTDGTIKKGDPLMFAVAGKTFSALEVGIFAPEEMPTGELSTGEIGYIVTGIKEAGIASVGDTITSVKAGGQPALPMLAGYAQPKPVVWASLYPESQDDFPTLRLGLSRLKLSDSSLTFEEETSGTLGRGFRCGFLGMLHMEIITERLKREFNLELIVTTPSITYELVLTNAKKEIVYSPVFFPDDGQISEVREPWVNAKIISPARYLGVILGLLHDHEAEVGETDNFGDERAELGFTMPLREMMRGFFDELKSVSSGFTSISYEIGESRPADVTRMDILVADEPVLAFARVVSRRRVEEDGRKAVEKLAQVLPRQMFTTKIQARALGRIIASETLSAMRKDVTQHMYGGDITRKMKLREKQKKGKKKMKDRGTVNIPQDVFLKMMRDES